MTACVRVISSISLRGWTKDLGWLRCVLPTSMTTITANAISIIGSSIIWSRRLGYGIGA